jgi:hypothetical protein
MGVAGIRPCKRLAGRCGRVHRETDATQELWVIGIYKDAGRLRTLYRGLAAVRPQQVGEKVARRCLLCRLFQLSTPSRRGSHGCQQPSPSSTTRLGARRYGRDNGRDWDRTSDLPRVKDAHGLRLVPPNRESACSSGSPTPGETNRNEWFHSDWRKDWRRIIGPGGEPNA